MRKTCFFASVLLFLNAVCADGTEISAKNTRLELYAAGSVADGEFGPVTAGGKLVLPFAEFRYYQKAEDSNMALSLFTDKFAPNYPLMVKAGNLSAAGLLSKLNNPMLSSVVSPFSQPATEVVAVTANAGGYSSFTAAPAVFAQSAYRGSFVRRLAVNAFWSPQKQLAVSSLVQFAPGKKTRFALSAAAGIFPYKESVFSTWYSDFGSYYRAGEHVCANAQASVLLGNFSEVVTFSVYESPFGVPLWTIRSEGKFSARTFSAGFSAFYNGNPMTLTSSEKRLAECVQLKAGMQCKGSLRLVIPWIVQAGTGFYTKIEYRENYADVKGSAGIRLISPLMMITATAQAVGGSKDDEAFFDYATVQLKTSLYFEKLVPGLTGTFTCNPSSDYSSVTNTWKLALGLYAPTRPSVTFSGAAGLSQKDGEFAKGELSAAVTVRLALRYLVCTAKFAYESSF